MRFAIALTALALLSSSAQGTVPVPVSFSAPSPVQKNKNHVDNRFGYSFAPPKKWTSIAMKTDAAWLTAKYVSDKSYFYTDPDTKWTNEHTPELLLIAFIKENMKKRKEEVTEEDEDGVTTKTVEINNPYKSYEDFLDRTYSGGGFYIDSTEEKKLGELSVTVYTIKVEKLTRTGPKRIVTWIYHTEDIDYAMQIEVLEGEYRKLKKILDRSFRSFEEVERTEGYLPTSGKTDDSVWITIKEMTEGPPKERRTKRMKSQKQLHERAIAQLPDGWEAMEQKDLLILNHADKKYAKRLGKHATVFLNWVEKTFSYIGDKEYVRAPIIRICEGEGEERAFNRGVRSGGGGWFTNADEIVTHKDDSGFIGYEVGYVNRSLFRHWMNEKDRELSWALPEWLQSGIYEYVEGARAKGNSLKFRIDDWGRDDARLAISQGTAASPRDLLRMTREEFLSSAGGGNYWDRRSQSMLLVRYLMSPEAKRTKQARDLIELYILALKEVIAEEKKKENEDFKTAQEGAESEEEEAERAKARAEMWRAREKATMEEIYQRVFGDWTEKDWKAFERGFFAYVG
jgi:hypothetical protein